MKKKVENSQRGLDQPELQTWMIPLKDARILMVLILSELVNKYAKTLNNDKKETIKVKALA